MENSQQKKTPQLSLIIAAIFGVMLLVAYLAWQQGGQKQNAGNNTNGDTDSISRAVNVSNGEALAANYCKSCHLLPDPSLINKAKWKTVFPQMAIRLGILSHGGEEYNPDALGSDVFVPVKPVLSHKQWQDIIDYYMTKAPEKLPAQNRSVPITKQLPFFSMIYTSETFTHGQVMGTFVKIDTTVKPARIFVADGMSQKLFLLTHKMKVLDSISTNGPVVDISFNNGELLVCSLGKDLTGNSDKFGNVYKLQISKGGKMKFANKAMFDKLARPAQVLPVDLNGDDKTDYVICEFGNLNGALSWMENNGNGTFAPHIIKNVSGALKAYLEYPPNSKVPDLWVLFSQGDEGIWHFINKGHGVFEEKRVLQFPAVFGSSSFERVDINHDGYKDIVYTCGDNGDATIVVKPYHGIYIFLNDGRDIFKQKYFYPINGCYKALTRDFDGDGNIDIATAALYTDPGQPEEGFVFLKNTGDMNFVPYGLPRDTRFERALTMDVGDLNGDGKLDLLLGNAFLDYGAFGYNVAEPLFIVLKNTGR
jgi:hypothetical protein